MSCLLITGADGFVGKNLLLKETDFERIVVHVLPHRLNNFEQFCSTQLPKSTQDKLIFIASDFNHLEGLKLYLPYLTNVIHCVGEMKGCIEEHYYEANVNCLKKLLDFFFENNPKQLQRIIVLSSQAAAGPCIDKTIKTEECLCEPASAYGASKLEEEVVAKNFLHKFPITILRPCSIYGRYDFCFLNLFKLAKAGWFGYLFSKEKLINMIHINDLVNAVYLSLNDKGSGNVYFISDGNIYSMNDIKEKLSKIYNKNLKDLFLKGMIAELYLLFFDIMEYFGASKNILNSIKSEELKKEYWLCSNQKIKETLHFSPKIDLETGLRETANWYSENLWI